MCLVCEREDNIFVMLILKDQFWAGYKYKFCPLTYSIKLRHTGRKERSVRESSSFHRALVNEHEEKMKISVRE